MASKPAPAILSPLVAEGRRLIAEAEAICAQRDAIAAQLAAKNAELEVINQQLIALGAGRYRDEENHTATVVAEVAKTLSADTFRLKEKVDAERILAIAGREAFRKLLERLTIFVPRSGFDGIARAILTPAKAREVINICLVPGTLGGGRKAHVRWK